MTSYSYKNASLLLFSPNMSVVEAPESPSDFLKLFGVENDDDLTEFFPFDDLNIALICKSFRTNYEKFYLKIDGEFIPGPIAFVHADPIEFIYRDLSSDEISEIKSRVKKVEPWEKTPNS